MRTHDIEILIHFDSLPAVRLKSDQSASTRDSVLRFTEAGILRKVGDDGQDYAMTPKGKSLIDALCSMCESVATL